MNYFCYLCTRKTGKSCTASSLGIPQDGNIGDTVSLPTRLFSSVGQST